MRELDKKIKFLHDNQKHWCITGVAGFIGSNLLEFLLKHNQKVVGLDNFSTGFKHNLESVQRSVSADQWAEFKMLESDISDLNACQEACRSIDHILHQAALGSVPRSIADPLTTNRVNIEGFLNMLIAGRDQGVKTFVYASSSSVYGDHPDLPKKEDHIGEPLSPYAVTKYVNELYASVFQRTYGFRATGLRYFNVFGKRQDPDGAYAAVMPRWVSSMLNGQRVTINGKGDTSRDFCYIDNAVEANILASLTDKIEAQGQVYNVAFDDQTSLYELFEAMRNTLTSRLPGIEIEDPEYQDYRAGDVLHSRADITKARKMIGYNPEFDFSEGLDMAMNWYIGDIRK